MASADWPSPELTEFRPACSVVIPTRDRPRQLEACLEALSRVAYPHFETLVVNNSPTDKQAKEIAARAGARYTVEPLVGLSRARNRGARESAGEIIAYLDDDAIPKAEWLAGLVAEFRDPRVMAVAGLSEPLDPAQVYRETICWPEERSPANNERRVLDPGAVNWFEVAYFGSFASGRNMAFRRQAFEVWPGFDERLGLEGLIPGCEDLHAFFSLLRRGYKAAYTPRAIVRHPFPRTREEYDSRWANSAKNVAAYLTLLFVEDPAFRQDALARLWGTLRGRKHWAQLQGPRPAPLASVPLWRKVLAGASGPFTYARVRLKGRGRAEVRSRSSVGIPPVAPSQNAHGPRNQP